MTIKITKVGYIELQGVNTVKFYDFDYIGNGTDKERALAMLSAYTQEIKRRANL